MPDWRCFVYTITVNTVGHAGRFTAVSRSAPTKAECLAYGWGGLTKGHLGNGRLEHRKRRNTCLHHTGGLPPELLNGCMQYLLADPLYVDILMLEASCSHADS